MAQVSNLLRHENWTKSGPVVSRMPGEEIESLEERAAATVADRRRWGCGASPPEPGSSALCSPECFRRAR
jgi:hypothetical protein